MKKIRNILLGAIIVACIFLTFVIIDVQYSFRNRIVSLDDIDEARVAVVLGASLFQRQPSPVLQDRLDTGLELYLKGKVKKLVLSGDNRNIDYNEPMAMKRYLLVKGVPEKDLILDYAGRRTYDTCYRARDIFELKKVVLVTQKFHVSRALYLCNKLRIDAIGVSADQSTYDSLLQWQVRELGASIRAWLDINIIKGKPVLGKKEPIF